MSNSTDNPNKYMFEAKRLDNGKLERGYLQYCIDNGLYVLQVDGVNLDISQSTIKPLFTTGPEPKSEWLFENAGMYRLDQLGEKDISSISMAWIHRGLTDWGELFMLCEEGEWRRLLKGEHLDPRCAYRVKTPNYRLVDAIMDITALNPKSPCLSSIGILRKFAKANSLDSNPAEVGEE